MDKKKALRWFFLLISVSLAIWVSVSILRAFHSTPDQVKLVTFDELAGNTLEFIRQGTERFFQIGVLILGGIWTLAVVDRDQRVKLADKPELFMFVIATLLFVFEFYFLQQYDEIVQRVLWDVRSLGGEQGPKLFPDLLHSPFLDLHQSVVVQCFYAGLAVSGLTVFSLCRLREREVYR